MSAADAHTRLGGKVALELLNKLMPYQRIGVAAAVLQAGRVLLADEMGLGKTLRLILYLV